MNQRSLRAVRSRVDALLRDPADCLQAAIIYEI
jgi:hypothetical protein